MLGDFEEFSGRPGQLSTMDIEGVSTDLPADVTAPTIKEISLVMRQIKDGKAEGPDGIPAEALNLDLEVTTKMLHILFGKI